MLLYNIFYLYLIYLEKKKEKNMLKIKNLSKKFDKTHEIWY